MQAFISGFILSLGLIIPLGVQNMFVFNQGIMQRRWAHSIPSMMTAFICDGVLILFAIVGISKVVFSVPALINTIYVLGFIFLIYMGWTAWNSKATSGDTVKPLSAKQQIGFTMTVSLLNPHAIIDTVLVIGTNSANYIGSDKFCYTFACIFVSFSWFLALSLSGHCLKKVDALSNATPWLNKISAVVIWGVALYIGTQMLSQF